MTKAVQLPFSIGEPSKANNVFYPRKHLVKRRSSPEPFMKRFWYNILKNGRHNVRIHVGISRSKNPEATHGYSAGVIFLPLHAAWEQNQQSVDLKPHWVFQRAGIG